MAVEVRMWWTGGCGGTEVVDERLTPPVKPSPAALVGRFWRSRYSNGAAQTVTRAVAGVFEGRPPGATTWANGTARYAELAPRAGVRR